MLYRVRNLTIVWADIDVSLNEHDLSDAQMKRLCEIRESCRHVLEGTQRTLNQYSSLESQGANTRERAKRIWKRVKWEPDDVRDLRSQITLNVNFLNSFIAASTRDVVLRLEQRQDRQVHRQEHQEIIDWLTPIDNATQHSDFIRRRQPGTGQWLIDASEYGNWKATKGDVLFCHGIPGAGKTILSSIVVENLQECYATENVAVCHFFCNFQRQDEQRLENVVLSLLKQLAQIATTIPDSLEELFNRCQARRCRPSLNEATETIHSIAASSSRIFVVVDALDECQTTDGYQRQLISLLMDLRTTGANMLATSRPVPHISDEFKDFAFLEVLASSEDIRKYIEGNVQDLPGFVGRNPDLLHEIKNKIIQATDGMYVPGFNFRCKSF